MIAVVGLPNTKNFGDPILLRNTEYLLQSIESEETLKEIDLEFSDASSFCKFSYKVVRKISKSILKFGTGQYWRAMIFFQNLFFRKYYERDLRGADAIVMAGGGIIKFRYEELGIRTALIIEIAQGLNIPVMLSGVGVEGYDAENGQAQYLKKALNLPVVKTVTTRDDLSVLKSQYLNPAIFSEWTPDPAWWTDLAYNTESDFSDKKPVGLGLIRKNIFWENGVQLTNSELFDFWHKVCLELSSREVSFELFTNGVAGDGIFIKEFLDKFPELCKVPVRVPQSDVELVKIIGGYSRILGSRMHTSIVAFSLQVPSMSIVWNNKLNMFYEQIGHTERLISAEQMKTRSAVEIVEQLLAITYGEKDSELKKNERLLTRNHLEQFLKQNI